MGCAKSYCPLAASTNIPQTAEDISRLVSSLKVSVIGEPDAEASSDVITQVANEVYAQDVIRLMIVNLEAFEFEVGQHFSAAETAFNRTL